MGAAGPPVPVSIEPDGLSCASKNYQNFDGISADGSVVIFSCGGQLFARIDNGEADARTVPISEPSSADCAACDTSVGERREATFESLSADGSKVFFATSQPLLGGNRSENVYEYDFGAPQASADDPDGRVLRVSGGSWSSNKARVERGPLGFQPTGADPVDGVVVSEDGSHAYFVAEGVLGGTVNRNGQVPVEGRENLYVFERDAQFPAGHVSFIATMKGGGYASTTPNGAYFVFPTSSDLTSDDTSTAGQIFEYNAQTGELVRCSIGQGGFNDDGNTDSFSAALPFEDQAPTPHIPLSVQPVGVSDNGEYVAFESSDGLTPGALNGVTETNVEGLVTECRTSTSITTATSI